MIHKLQGNLLVFNVRCQRCLAGQRYIADVHLADAIELLTVRNQASLSTDRSPKDPYVEKPPVWD